MNKTTSKWQPIETYDALPEKKRRLMNVVFYVAATKPMPHRTDFLYPTVSTTRRLGSREITGWFELPSMLTPPVQS